MVPSLAIAVIGTALTSLALLAVGIGSIMSRFSRFGMGIAGVLVLYALLVATGAYLGWRRHRAGLGIMLAAALLHLAAAVDFAMHGDVVQKVGSGVAAAIFLTIVVASLWPTTRKALNVTGQPREPEAQ